MAEKLTDMIYVEEGGFPTKNKAPSIIHLYKRKGNPEVCDNQRGISGISGKLIV